MRFRTQSGALYLFDGAAVTRLAEHPPIIHGDHAFAPGAAYAATLVVPVEVGAPALFRLTDSGQQLRTSPVAEVLS